MLEGLLEKFLLQYFGDYIDNLDRNKLSIGVRFNFENLFLNFLLDMVRKSFIRRYYD